MINIVYILCVNVKAYILGSIITIITMESKQLTNMVKKISEDESFKKRYTYIVRCKRVYG